MINILILENDDDERETNRRVVSEYCNDNRVKSKIDTFPNAQQFFLTNKVYDIAFLDIDMPSVNGMQVARYIRKKHKNTLIVFITRMAQMALKGYEVDAVGFVLKPVEYGKLSVILDKAIKHIEHKRTNSFIIKKSQDIFSISIDEIEYVEVKNRELIFYVGKETITQLGKMSELERNLSHLDFCRCSNSYLVNLKYVKSLVGNKVNLLTASLTVSRSYKKVFRERMIAYLESNNGENI